ncbi:MAG: response regulator [Anaerolineae bacterium]
MDGTPDEIAEVYSDVPEDFVALVRDALAHLYDYAHLQRHPLTKLLGPLLGAASDRAKALRNLILDTLEQLNPGDSVSRNDREWRAYGILVRRYLDGFSIDEISEELHISLRQFQREHRKGLLAAASMLWSRAQRQVSEPVTMAAPPDDSSDGLQQEVERLGLIQERVDLVTLVQSVLGPAQALAAERGVRLYIKPVEAPAWAWADQDLAKQALLAALSALIAACPASLAVLCACTEEEACVQLDAEPPLAADAERLAAVIELMQVQGGHLHIATGDDQSAEVRLRFRRARGTQVLLVDDNERVLQLFERYLAADGYLVTGATDAQQALAALAQRKPDAIILDVMMRNVDGWQLLQKLRAKPELQAVPVIVCSVLNEPDLALALGAQYYLKKPVAQQQMLAALREVLGESNPAGRHPTAP